MPEFILPFASIGFEVRKLERPLLRPCCWQRDARKRTCVDIGCVSFFTGDPSLPDSKLVHFWAQDPKYSLSPTDPKNELFPNEVATHVAVMVEAPWEKPGRVPAEPQPAILFVAGYSPEEWKTP